MADFGSVQGFARDSGLNGTVGYSPPPPKLGRVRERVTGGLTLAELILAVLLLGLLIISVMGLFLALLGASAKSSDQTIGVLYAERVLDAMAHNAASTYPAFTNASSQTDVYDHDANNKTTFVYSVTATDLEPGTFALPATPGQTWLLEAEVRWWSVEAARSRAGQGQLFVRQARVVYVPK